MPRRNLHYLVFTAIVSVVCYLRADSANRGRYGAMKDTFFEAMGKIEEYYLYFDEKNDPQRLFDGAMQGMVRKLDKNSAYMTRDETRQFTQTIDQQFGGIGIEVAWDEKEGGLTVLSPIVGTPAYEAGIMAGDRIVTIEEKPTKGMTLEDAVKLLQGNAGEKVRLAVVHAGEENAVPFTIERAIINTSSVLGDSRNPDDSWRFTLDQDPRLGYIRISQFGKRTKAELVEALAKCRDAGVRGLILDLRNNPGGLLTQATEICDLFLAKGVIVTTVDRRGQTLERYEATGKAPYPDLPLAVIVNEHSASAAEIVAACLQDNARAVIIGERTYGKGTVQSPFVLEDQKSILKLTIAEYRSPSGRNIHRREGPHASEVWGVSPKPEFEVKLSPEAEMAIAIRRRDRDIVRRPKPKATATASPTAAPSATAEPSGTAQPGSSAAPTPSALLKPSASATPTKASKPAASSTATGKPTGEAKPEANQGEAPKPAPDIPADDPQLRRAIEYFQPKPATTKAA